jgi:hypothetical protein
MPKSFVSYQVHADACYIMASFVFIGGANPGSQIITATGAGTFTVPAFAVRLRVRGWGGGGGGTAYAGGHGGSGIVIISYLGRQRGTGGTVTSSGGYTIHTFTSSGTYNA